MDKKLLEFLNGERNVVNSNFTITREKTPNGTEYLKILSGNNIKKFELYSFWYNPESNKKNNKNPKHTGGKKPYVMLMVDEIEKLREKGVKNIEELIGYVVCLSKYIEWHTGRLIHKRSKKSIRYKDLQKIYQCSNKKLNKMINLMKKHDLLYHTDEGYFISPKFVKKGKTKR